MHSIVFCFSECTDDEQNTSSEVWAHNAGGLQTPTANNSIQVFCSNFFILYASCTALSARHFIISYLRSLMCTYAAVLNEF